MQVKTIQGLEETRLHILLRDQVKCSIWGHHTIRQKSYAKAPCCMGRRCTRTELYPCCGLCGADVLRAPEVQHAVQNIAGDGYLGRLSPIRLRAQPATNDAFPARDIGFHESAPVIP